VSRQYAVGTNKERKIYLSISFIGRTMVPGAQNQNTAEI